MSRIAVDSRDFSSASQHPLAESFPVAEAIVMECVSKALFESEKKDLKEAIKKAKETGDKASVKKLMDMLRVLTLQLQSGARTGSQRLVTEVENDSAAVAVSSRRLFVETDDDVESSRRFLLHCFSSKTDAQKEFFSVLLMQLMAADCIPSVRPILATEGSVPAEEDDAVRVDFSFIQRVIGTEWESTSPSDEGVFGLPFHQALPDHLNALLVNDLPGLLLGLILLNQPWEAGDVIYLQEINRKVFLKIFDLKVSRELPETDDLLCFLNNGMMPNGERSELLSALSNNRQFRKNIALSFLGMVLIPYSFVSTFTEKTEGVEFYQKLEAFVDRVSGSPHLYDCISILEFSDLDAYFSKYFSRLSQFFSVLTVEKTRSDFLDQYLYVVFLLLEKKITSESRLLLETVCAAIKRVGVSLVPNEIFAAFTLIEILHEIPRTVNLADLDWMKLAQIERQLAQLHQLFEGWSAASSSRIFSVAEREQFSHFAFSLKNLLSLTLSLYQKLKRNETGDSAASEGEVLAAVVERNDGSLESFHQFLLSWTERGVFLDKECLERKVIMAIFAFAKTTAVPSALLDRIEYKLNTAATPGMLFHELFLIKMSPELAAIKPLINAVLESFILFMWNTFFLKNKWAEALEMPSSTDMCFLGEFRPLTTEAISHCMAMLSEFHLNNFAERFMLAQFREQNHVLSRLPAFNPYFRLLQRLHEKECSGFSVLDRSEVAPHEVWLFESRGMPLMGDGRSVVSTAVTNMGSAISSAAAAAVASTAGVTQTAQNALAVATDAVVSRGGAMALFSNAAGSALSLTTGVAQTAQSAMSWRMGFFGGTIEGGSAIVARPADQSAGAAAPPGSSSRGWFSYS